MKYKNNILPFNQFWVNCDFNSRYSILNSYDDRFEKLAYNNTYKYELRVSDYDSLLYGIHVESESDESERYLNYIPIRNIRELDNLEYIIKKLVLNNDIFLIGVDLYNYIPGSVCWNKYHWYHYSLVKGYDEDKKIFFVLDDNLSGYNEFEVPIKSLLQAARDNQMDDDGYIVIVDNDKIRQYDMSLDIEKVKQNAISICENIEHLEDRILWCMMEESIAVHLNKDLDAMYLYQIRNRQLANQLLFRCLEKNNSESETVKYDYVINEFMDLENEWRILQKEFIKIYHSKQRNNQVEKANKICRELLNREYKVWRYVIECL